MKKNPMKNKLMDNANYVSSMEELLYIMQFLNLLLKVFNLFFQYKLRNDEEKKS